MCFRFLKLLLILLFSLAFLAGSDVCVSKAALMTSCLALGLALIMVDSLWLSKSQNQEIGNQSLFSILSQYRWHPCWAWLAWAIYMGIRILQTPNHHYLLTHGYSLIIGSLGFIIGFLLLFYQSKKPWLMNVWLWTLGIICFIQIIFCILQFTVDSNLIVHERSVARESDYVKGTYFFEGGFGLFASLITSFLGAYLLSQFKRLKLIQKIVAGLGFVVMMFLTFHSNSLTGMIIASLCLTLFPLFYYLSFISIFKRRLQWKLLTIGGLSAAIAVVIVGIIWNQQLPIQDRLDIKFLSAYNARLQYADLAFALMAEKPWFGHGARMFNHLYLTVYDGDSSIWHNYDVERVHQEVIQLLCDYGMVGLALFITPLIWSLIYFIKLAKDKIKSHNTSLYTEWLKDIWPFFILSIAILITTLGDFSLHYSNNCFLLGLCLGAINAWLKPPHKEA